MVIEFHPIPAGQDPGEANPNPIPIFHEWNTNRRASIRSLENLRQDGVVTITGIVVCDHCKVPFTQSFNLEACFNRVREMIIDINNNNHGGRYERAPDEWMNNPVFDNCTHCHREKCLKPLIESKKNEINWLFLCMGQYLGYCTIDQLEYFCKHANTPYRTGAKNRLLYLAYIGICNQLTPQDPLFQLPPPPPPASPPPPPPPASPPPPPPPAS